MLFERIRRLTSKVVLGELFERKMEQMIMLPVDPEGVVRRVNQFSELSEGLIEMRNTKKYLDGKVETDDNGGEARYLTGVRATYEEGVLRLDYLLDKGSLSRVIGVNDGVKMGMEEDRKTGVIRMRISFPSKVYEGLTRIRDFEAKIRE